MKKTIICLLILLITTVLMADLDEIYSNVLTHYRGISTFQAELTQENYWKEIDINKTSQGMIYYNADSLRISYSEPDKQQLYVLGNDILIYEPANSQAIWMDKGDFKIKPVEIMISYWENSEVALISQSGDLAVISLTSSEETIEIVIDNNFIKSVRVADKAGNYVNYTFAAELYNKSLPAETFIPQLPRETNVIDNRIGGR